MLGRALYLLGLTNRRCSLCGKEFLVEEQGYMCPTCLGDIKPAHPILYESKTFISGYRVFGVYEGALAEALKLLKFRSVIPIAGILGSKVGRHLHEYIEEIEPDAITYVPVHTLRFWRRGFDHNRKILSEAGVEAESLLWRARHSKPLASYGKEERFSVVKNAFRVKKDRVDWIEGKRVLVFDDILTTGATSQAVAELLLSIGAEGVFFYFLATER